jgi:thiamine pyrophosphate-dependent acetolactate synthase large subunit-like protein
MELIATADVAVVFGAGLNQFTMRFGALFAPGTRVVQVDIAPAATHPHVGGFIRGDARLVAEALCDELAQRDAAPSGWRERVDIAASAPARAATRWRPTAASIRVRSRCGSVSCWRARRPPATASSSPTAATSSAGRTCTGRSPRPTA